MNKNDSTNSAYLKRLLSVECRDATYPVNDSPLVFAKAKGSIVQDVEGKSYVDLCAGFGALPLGHNPDCIRAALKRWTEDGRGMPPIEHGMGDVYPSSAKVDLIEALLSVLPRHLKRVSLSLTGSQAVEIALKTAMLATGNSGFVAFKDGYHGVDLGVLPVTSREDFSAPFKTWLTGASVVEVSYGADQGTVFAAIQKLSKLPSGFAGIIVEPAQGRAGVVFPRSGWLSMLLDQAHQGQGLLIFDEVFTGIGRLGEWSSSEEVPADLICLGKALGGGFPLSACVGTEAAMNAWPQSSGESIHTGTFFGHPLTCEMALATITEMRSINLVAVVKTRGEKLLQDLQALLTPNQKVKDVRGLGMMFAIEFKTDGAGVRAMDLLRKSGVIALVSGSRGRVLSLTPALNIADEDLKASFRKIAEVISDPAFT